MKVPATRARIALLFTAYPVATETFLQREVAVLGRRLEGLELHALWRAGAVDSGGIAARGYGLRGLCTLLYWLPYWVMRRPRVVGKLVGELWRRPHGLLNYVENLLGMAFGLSCARAFERRGIGHVHAVWASAPAMGARVIHLLTGCSYSFAGHAYDLWEHGGDAWFAEKAATARWIRTSSAAGAARIAALGAGPTQVMLVRRGLPRIALLRLGAEERQPRTHRLVSVGRMVEKMGHWAQLALLAELARRGLDYTMDWVGDGAERKRLEGAVQRLGLAGRVRFHGQLPYAEVERCLARSELFIFTGCVDRRGDRAGFPNAIGEAMAAGVVVAATAVGAVTEGIRDDTTGLVLSGEPTADAERICTLLADGRRCARLRAAAHAWVCAEFALERNLERLCERLLNDVGKPLAQQGEGEETEQQNGKSDRV